jgi:hypothetical protein
MSSPLVLRVASSFAAALPGSPASLVFVLSRSWVVPGCEGDQISSALLHRTYIMPEKLRAVNLLFENKVF